MPADLSHIADRDGTAGEPRGSRVDGAHPPGLAKGKLKRVNGIGDIVQHSAAKTLVIGGARSGKSRHAEQRAAATGLAKVYVATATAWDDEMRARIAKHRQDRAGADWRTLEEPLRLLEVLGRETSAERVLLVDCLTLWLTNVMLGERDVEAECRALVAALPGLAGPAIFVSNEVGWGIVPENPLARAFRDAQGRLNQMMAEACEEVVLVAAGLPLMLKSRP